MSSNGRQFDPVAAAATSALDTSQRSIRRVRSQTDAPQLPAESQTFTGARNAIQSVAQFSPANVLAKGDSPIPTPGGSGQNALPDIQGLLPDMQGQSPLPNPQDVLPGNTGDSQRTQNRTQSQSTDGGTGGTGRTNDTETRT